MREGADPGDDDPGVGALARRRKNPSRSGGDGIEPGTIGSEGAVVSVDGGIISSRGDGLAASDPEGRVVGTAGKKAALGATGAKAPAPGGDDVADAAEAEDADGAEEDGDWDEEDDYQQGGAFDDDDGYDDDFADGDEGGDAFF